MKTYILIINMLMAAIAVNATDFTETFTGLKSTDVTNIYCPGIKDIENF